MTQQHLQRLKGQVIVSVQAEPHEPFYAQESFLAMAQSVLNGGAKGLRLAGKSFVQLARTQWGDDLPIIGLTKPDTIPKHAEAEVYITPTYADVASLANAGADIVALDATLRPRPGGETLETIVQKAHQEHPQLLLMADISTLSEGLNAEALGFDIISTTLSGYTTETCDKKHKGPDFELLSALIAQTKTPIILEGRIWNPAEIKQAFSLGAHAVVIGSAITRPHLITQRFIEAL